MIGNAVEMGIPHIIHVSSVTALYDPDAHFLNEYSPPGTAKNAYGKSKVESEKVTESKHHHHLPDGVLP